MAAEATMRSKLVLAMRRFHAFPVENRGVAPGTPDINYVGGWIECKYIKQWPSRVSTKVKVRKFTNQQRWWHLHRRVAGGTSWFLLRVGVKTWVLLDGATAAINVDNVSKKKLLELSTYHGSSLDELIEVITTELPPYDLSNDEIRKMIGK